jgi:hypothetical protein
LQLRGINTPHIPKSDYEFVSVEFAKCYLSKACTLMRLLKLDPTLKNDDDNDDDDDGGGGGDSRSL